MKKLLSILLLLISTLMLHAQSPTQDTSEVLWQKNYRPLGWSCMDAWFSPDGKKIYACFSENNGAAPFDLLVLNAENGDTIKTMVSDIRIWDISNDGKNLIGENVNHDNTYLIDAETLESIKGNKSPYPYLGFARIPSTNNFLVTNAMSTPATKNSPAQDVYLTEIDFNNLQTKRQISWSNYWANIAVSPDSKYFSIVAKSDFAYLDLWDLEKFQIVANLGKFQNIQYMKFSPDGKYLAVAANEVVNNTFKSGIYLFDLQTKSQIDFVNTKVQNWKIDFTLDSRILIYSIGGGGLIYSYDLLNKKGYDLNKGPAMNVLKLSNNVDKLICCAGGYVTCIKPSWNFTSVQPDFISNTITMNFDSIQKKLLVQSNLQNEFVIKISDLRGRIVFTFPRQFIPSNGSISLQLPNLPTGAYLINLTSQSDNQTLKIIME